MDEGTSGGLATVDLLAGPFLVLGQGTARLAGCLTVQQLGRRRRR